MADLLHFIESVDGRRLTKSTPDAWMAILGGLDYRDAMEVVKHHFRTSTEWLTPAHIAKGVKALRASRLSAVGVIGVSSWERMDAGEEIRTAREITRAVASGLISESEYREYQNGGVTWSEFIEGKRKTLPQAQEGKEA